MATYRAYRVDRHRRIKTGEWLEAPSDEAAVEQAEELCEEDAPIIEIWQSTRLVDEIECGED
ncbi:hypothetical protein [Phenylobacterium sp.]|jgi:hypothetical protein|uniref:hypothetical protein n=1 Tax=Phenylobacterium sp. TaxID=1871053 RepID=UPI002F420F5C